MYGKTKEWCKQNKDTELAQKLIINNCLQSERMKGKGNPMYGRNDQCYGARKWNESVKGKTAVEIYGEEWAKKRSQELSNIMKEKWKSEEYRKKKEITPEQRKKQSEKIKKFNEDNKCFCAYCKREFDPLNYKRWHGEKCKKVLDLREMAKNL